MGFPKRGNMLLIGTNKHVCLCIQTTPFLYFTIASTQKHSLRMTKCEIRSLCSDYPVIDQKSNYHVTKKANIQFIRTKLFSPFWYYRWSSPRCTMTGVANLSSAVIN